MVERIGGGGGSLAREAILAALKNQARQSDEVRELAAGVSGEVAGSHAPAAGAPDFAQELREGLRAVDQQVRGVDQLPQDLVSGRIQDFHEVAVQIKQAEFSFRFAMEVRNKLVDAYREVMRMNV